MAAPLYSQKQIAAMIRTPKYVSFDKWQEQWEKGRDSTDEQRRRVQAKPEDTDDLTEFTIESCRCVVRGEASFTLFGKLLGYAESPICRYEIQIGRHANPKWFPPQYITSRILHKHVYNERAIKEGWSWDKCAEPINSGPKLRRVLSLQQAIDRLTPIFLKENRIEIQNPQEMGLFFRGN